MSKIQKTVEYLLGSIIGMLTANYLLLNGLADSFPAAGWAGPLKILLKAAPWLFLMLNLYPA
ncbi:MAG: hypothetical protein K2O34_02715, partial [Acetatifactor sp.]|nr:hypothetical protein [Acetatifactor sp.]